VLLGISTRCNVWTLRSPKYTGAFDEPFQSPNEESFPPLAASFPPVRAIPNKPSQRTKRSLSEPTVLDLTPNNWKQLVPGEWHNRYINPRRNSKEEENILERKRTYQSNGINHLQYSSQTSTCIFKYHEHVYHGELKEVINT
jgi:hypothetical protein